MAETTFFENMPLRVGRTVLPSGLTLLTAETGSFFVHAELMFRTGGVDDTNHSGLAHLLEHLICKDGTRERHPLIRELQDREANYNASTSQQSTAFYFNGPASERALMIDTLFRLGFGRSFEDGEVDAERPVVLAEYHQRRKETLVRRAMDGAMFGAKEPWTFLPIGTEEGIRSISASDINARLERDYRLGNAVLIVCGGVMHEEVVGLIERRNMTFTPSARRPLPPAPARKNGEFDLVVEDSGEPPEAGIVWGLTDTHRLPHPRLETLPFLVEERFGKIFRRLRVDLGKAYGVNSFVHRDMGMVSVGANTDPEHFDLVIREIDAAVAALADGPPESELRAIERKWRLAMRAEQERHSTITSFGKWSDMLGGMWIRDEYMYLPADAAYVSLEELREQFRQLAREERTVFRIRD